ncbi:MAG: hypothetical protein HC862_22135 [Scytonema sp. RU_4_4]|nr:hypothetical protein [Scytonema sp. RU_4_4]NJR74152.1 hypothetical protein [Scytonema sp. CRU_2_7]
MNYYNKSQFAKVVYFNVTVNGKRDMVPMQVNDDGSLKYISRYVEDQTIDSESSISLNQL